MIGAIITHTHHSCSLAETYSEILGNHQRVWEFKFCSWMCSFCLHSHVSVQSPEETYRWWEGRVGSGGEDDGKLVCGQQDSRVALWGKKDSPRQRRLHVQHEVHVHGGRFKITQWAVPSVSWKFASNLIFFSSFLSKEFGLPNLWLNLKLLESFPRSPIYASRQEVVQAVWVLPH